MPGVGAVLPCTRPLEAQHARASGIHAMRLLLALSLLFTQQLLLY